MVREKERRLEQIDAEPPVEGAGRSLVRLLDVARPHGAPDAAVFASLSDAIVRGRSELPPAVADGFSPTRAAQSRSAAVLSLDAGVSGGLLPQDGEPQCQPGFRRGHRQSAVGHAARRQSGNAAQTTRESVRRDNTLIKRFIRDAGIYRFQGGGHVNRYQLFVERAMALVEGAAGASAWCCPRGIATDHTSAPLRRRLLEQHDVDTLVGFDNRQAIFPIHRSVRFVLLHRDGRRVDTRRSIAASASTIRGVLDSLPDCRNGAGAYPITLTSALIARVGGDGPDHSGSCARRCDLTDRRADRQPVSATVGRRRLGRAVRAGAERHR